MYPCSSKVLLAAVVCLSVVVFFVMLLHVYARWLLRGRPSAAGLAATAEEHLRRLSSNALPGHTVHMAPLCDGGLDAKAVASLPKFVYRSEEHEKGLDCVICLGGMEEEEIGRRLPKCGHAFHIGCVDTWLASHSTCPICRASAKAEESATVVAADAEEAAPGESRIGGDEPVAMSGAEGGEVLIEIVKEDGPSNSSSSSSSSSSLGCSFKRMLSKSRSESRVFPTILVD